MCVVPWAPTLLDSELTELPGVTLAVGIYGLGGSRCRFCECRGGIRTGNVSGYKKPEVPGVLACGTASARPFMGYSEGVLLTEHAGTEALGLLWVIHSV